MDLLRALLEQEVDDLSAKAQEGKALPQSTMDKIKKLIRDGARPNKETGQFEPWGNALHLVHKAYEVAGVQRPTPDMPDLWKQYEENIQIAVKELSKERGIDGQWRMTAHDTHDYN